MRAIFAFLAFAIAGVANCLTPEQIAAIDRLVIEQFQPVNRIPGVGLAIVHGETSLARGYGYRDLEQGLQATSGTFFGIGSVSKSFLGLAVLRVLITAYPDLGEYVLDVPIRQLVPTYNFTSIDRYRSENMNMRDLLSHRACTLPESWGIYAAPYKDRAEFVYRQRYSESICLTRTEFVYNNGLIQEAGDIAAFIAGISFENLLMQLLQDIGMTNTTFVRLSEDYESMPLMSKPYYLEDGVLKRFNFELLKPVSIAPGSGGILTTPAEFVKYLRFHLNGGRVESTQVIPEHVMKWMHKVTNPFPGLEFRTAEAGSGIYGDIGYGLCLFIGTHNGFQTIHHGGYVTPYLTLMTMLPAHNIGILTTVNGPGSARVVNMTHQALHAQIMNILIDGPNALAVDPHLRFLSTEVETSHFKPTAGKKSQSHHTGLVKRDGHIPTDAPGIYGHPTSGEFNITRINDSTLYMNYGRYAQAFLVQRGSTDIYDAVWDSDFPQIFLADSGFVPPVSVDFSDPLVAYIEASGDRTPFYKDSTLDTLPVQPWEPGTC